MVFVSVPDYINSSSVQTGFDSGDVFFSGISGVLDGSFSSMYYSLTSSETLCSEREGNFTDITVRHNIENVATGCTYQLSISAQCGSERGPATNFTIIVPGKEKTSAFFYHPLHPDFMGKNCSHFGTL